MGRYEHTVGGFWYMKCRGGLVGDCGAWVCEGKEEKKKENININSCFGTTLLFEKPTPKSHAPIFLKYTPKMGNPCFRQLITNQFKKIKLVQKFQPSLKHFNWCEKIQTKKILNHNMDKGMCL